MTTWFVDTCDCIIEFNKNIQWIQTVRACRHHEHLRGQNMLNNVLAQSRRFNLAFGNVELTDNQIELVITAKELNKLRIRLEPRLNFDEHLPYEVPAEPVLTWIQRLRARLRI